MRNFYTVFFQFGLFKAKFGRIKEALGPTALTMRLLCREFNLMAWKERNQSQVFEIVLIKGKTRKEQSSGFKCKSL